MDDEEGAEEPNPNTLDDEEADATRVPLEVDDEVGMGGGDVVDGLGGPIVQEGMRLRGHLN